MLERIEIDVTQANELNLAVELAVQHSLPALVVSQSMVGEAGMLRIARQGKFKIITVIDWPKGDVYGVTKLQGTLASALQADGFEIVLTQGRTPDDTTAEANQVADMLRSINRTAEIRFVLHMHASEAGSIRMYEALLGARRPALVRTDAHTKLQASKVNAQVHREMCKKLKSIANLQIKVSGNVATLRTVQECNGVDRIAASLAQLESIIKELQRVPPGIKELLT